MQKTQKSAKGSKIWANVDGAWSVATVTEVGGKNKKNSRSLWIKRLVPSSSTSVLGPFLEMLKEQEVVKKYQISSEQTCNGSEEDSVVDPEKFVSDPTPDPNFREFWAPTPDQDPVSDPATLVSASRELRGKLALYL
jgi:hypothetical protein